MYCSNCGKPLNEGVRFCPNCGNEIKVESVKETKTIQIEENNSKKIKCPMCGSRNLQSYCENNDMVISKGGGYSGAKGCLGYLLFGPFGLLCGNCGSSQKNTVVKDKKLYWICGDCGHKFRNEEDLEKEHSLKKAQNIKVGLVLMALGIISLVSSIILMCYADSFFEIGVTGFILGPVFFIVGGVLLSKPTYESNDAEEENNEGKNI